jgi:hypothetical protein
MKIEITKKSLIIDPAPRRNKKNGIKLFFWRGKKDERESRDLPILFTNAIKGQRKYTLPNGVNCAIKKIEF